MSEFKYIARLSPLTVKEFGKYLKGLRRKKDMKIRELAELSGVSNAYISQLENGKRGLPSMEVVDRLSTHLGVSVNDMVGRIYGVDIPVREVVEEEVVNPKVAYLSGLLDASELTDEQLDLITQQVRGLIKYFKQS